MAQRDPDRKAFTRMSTVCSFDVFDTVLTRRVGSPHAVFDLLGQQLASERRIPTSAVAFARERRSRQEAVESEGR